MDKEQTGVLTDKDEGVLFIATPELPSALTKFAKTLKNVLVTHRSERSERERYNFLMLAAAHLLRDIHVPREFANAYIKLAHMLEDLEVGKAHPVLKPVPPDSGGPPDSTEIWMGRSEVALGVIAVIAAGKRQQAAAQYAEKQLGPALDRVRRSRTGQAWRAVFEWHSAFAAKAAGNDIAQTAYNNNVCLIRDLVLAKPEAERLAAATKYLRRVREKLLSN